MFVSATVTGLTDEPAHRLGTTHPQVPVIFCDVCFTTQTGKHVYTVSFKNPFPAATTWHAATKSVCSLSMTLNFKTLHVPILEFECRNLETKFPNFPSIRCNVLLESPVQVLHPDRGCDPGWQSTGSTTGVNRQTDSLTHLGVDSSGSQISTLVGFPLTFCLLLDPIPSQPVLSTVLRTSADSTDEETCNLGILFGLLTRGLVALIIRPFVWRQRPLLALVPFSFAFVF